MRLGGGGLVRLGGRGVSEVGGRGVDSGMHINQLLFQKKPLKEFNYHTYYTGGPNLTTTKPNSQHEGREVYCTSFCNQSGYKKKSGVQQKWSAKIIVFVYEACQQYKIMFLLA